MKKKIVLILLVAMVCLLPTKAEASTRTPILRTPTTTVFQMKEWAIAEEAADIFVELADTFYEVAVRYGIDPAVIYTQSAKETNFMKFTGVVTIDYHNPCGLKITQGGGDKDILAHKQFESWEEGITAMAHHLALYAGKSGFPKKDTPDPRHFSSLFGKAKIVEDLGGKWAPSPQYGHDIVNMMEHLRSFPKGKVARLSGFSRYDTSIRVSKYLNRLTLRVVIANGQNFPDALAASGLAHNSDAPILLTERDALPFNVEREIARTKAHYAYILGGEKAVSKAVEEKLVSMGLSVTRIAGGNRYETAAAIAEENEKITKSTPTTAVLVNGENFADSLSIASHAGRNNYPIYLTNGSSLDSVTYGKLRTMKKVIVVGGEKAVSAGVVDRLKKAGVNVERVYGESRYDTAVAVAEKLHSGATTALVASGEKFPDSLVGAVVGIKYNAPILLTKSNAISKETQGAMKAIRPNRILVLGGELAVGNGVFRTVQGLAN